jgi:hypothetical protein
MPQVARATATEQLVSDADHVQLSRLLIEHVWRADNGRAATVTGGIRVLFKTLR